MGASDFIHSKEETASEADTAHNVFPHDDQRGMNKVKLGSYAHVSLSVRNLRASTVFYEKLGFRHLWGNVEPHPWALFTDGKVNLHLYEFYFPSPALHYFSEHMGDKVLELMRVGIKAELQRSRDGNRMQHIFSDPNELSVMLMHHNDKEMPKPNGVSDSLLGAFGELSVNTENLTTSVEFWQKLDFALKSRGERPYPWAILTDGTLTIGLHQTTTFSSPSLTYFSDDIATRLKLLASKSLTVYKELKNADGIPEGAILHSPDAQTIFLLKGKE